MSKRRVHFAENVIIESKKPKNKVNKPVNKVNKPVAERKSVASSSKANASALFDPLNLYAEQEAEIAILEKQTSKDGTPAYPDIRELFNMFKPTADDLTRTYTEEELKEFCLRVKCEVRMDLFNPVDDYARRFKREGRLKNRSERYINKLLTKAVMKYKDTALYSQKDIDAHREFQWRERRRLNNLNLVVWEKEKEYAQNKKRKHHQNTLHPEITSQNSYISDDDDLIENTIQSYLYEAKADSDNNNNMSEEQQPQMETSSISNIDDDSISRQLAILHQSSEEPLPSSLPSISSPSSASPPPPPPPTTSPSPIQTSMNVSRAKPSNDNNNVIDYHDTRVDVSNSDISDSDEIDFLDIIESENVLSQLSKPPEQQQCHAMTQELNDLLTFAPATQEVACDITISSQVSQGLLHDVVQINTESMTIEEDYNGESEGQTHNSENVVQQSDHLQYDYFNSQIPLTSTQSQPGNTPNK